MKGFLKQMEQILYKNYLKYLKENKTPLYKALQSIPKCAAGILIALVLSGVVSFIFMCAEKLRQYFIVPLVIETIFCIIAYFYSERYEINNSAKYLENYKEYCGDIYNWLQNISISVTKDSIIEIKRRIDNKLEKMEKTKEKNRNTIERLIQVIVIPFVLAMFAALIKNESDANVIVAYGVYFIFFPIALLITLFGFFEVFNMINKSEFNKLKNFSDDLQGILDTQYVGGLFEKV